MAKIGILYLIDQLRFHGGAELHLLQVARRLDRSKFEPIVFPLRGTREFVRRFREYNVATEECNIKRFYTWDGIKAAARIGKLVRERNVKIIHSYFFDSDVLGTLVGKLVGVPVIIWSRRDMGHWGHRRRQILVYRILTRFVDRVIVVSNAVGEFVKKHEGLRSDKVVRIYNGVDVEHFDGRIGSVGVKRGLGVDEDDLIVCTVGNLHVVKGHRYFIEAASMLLEEFDRVRFLVVGEGELMDDLKLLVGRLGLNEKIVFLGRRDDIREVLSVADIAVLASTSEGFSNTILEYMSMGKAIVATAVGGNREAVIDGVTGMLVHAEDAASLAEGIGRLIRDRQLAGMLGGRARKRAVEVFSMRGMVEGMEKLYEEVVGEW